MSKHDPPQMGLDGLGNWYPTTSGVVTVLVAAGDSEKIALASAEAAVRSLYSFDGRCVATDSAGHRCELQAGHDLAEGHQATASMKCRWGMPPPVLTLEDDGEP